MRGFDTKALVLFPALENVESRGPAYNYQFKCAIANLLKYLESMGIEPHAFYTDDVARKFSDGRFRWVSTLDRADRFFIAKHCDGTSDAIRLEMIEFPDVYTEIRKKDAGEDNMSENQRFEMVLRHSSKAASRIIPTYKVVVHFMVTNRGQYKVASKPGDGKIRITVNAQNFIPKVFISGNEENAVDLLGVPYANRTLTVWEV